MIFCITSVMNTHHLELFYYVAKYEGITAAVRKMPYGIQQPAVSGQILQLEKELGVKLFNRRPFALTPEGEELYDFAYPFFSRLGEMEEQLRNEQSRHLRVAASASVLRDYLPCLLGELRKKEPELRLTLLEAEPSEVPLLISSQKVDIAVTIETGAALVDGLQFEELINLPLALYIPQDWKGKKLDNFLVLDEWEKGRVGDVPLIGLPPHEILNRLWRRGLGQRDVEWPLAVEVSSLDTVRSYVEESFGVGMGVVSPEHSDYRFRILPLKDFPSMSIGLMWQGHLKPIAAQFRQAAVERGKKLVKGEK